jgi:hypothetical protein
MNSAVQALLNGEIPERAHGRVEYRSWCACCLPQELTQPVSRNADSLNARKWPGVPEAP